MRIADSSCAVTIARTRPILLGMPEEEAAAASVAMLDIFIERPEKTSVILNRT
jgi:hypothetical protein